MREKLTMKQKTFAELYAYSGNATSAAKGAGYSAKTAEAMGFENLRKPKIQKYIKELTRADTNTRISTATERQEFLTAVMRDETQDLKHRLRACEILGRAQGDFIDRHHISVEKTLDEATDAELLREHMRLRDASTH